MTINTHVVLRPFQAAGTEVQAGQLVNAADWKNVERLVSTKYLRPMNEMDYVRAKKSTNKVQGKPLATTPKSAKRFILKRKG